MYFFETDNPVSGDAYKWDTDLYRYNIAVGRKLAPNVQFKMVFSDQDKFDFKYNTFRAYLTAAF